LLNALCAIANAAPPTSTPASTPIQAPASAPVSVADAPDEGFIEFLGSDDVGDARWWDFLKTAPARGNPPPPVPPPQDAKK
jgi:hypothetical protein